MSGAGVSPSEPIAPGRISIIGTPLTVQRFDDAIDELIRAARERRSSRAHFCTVHTVVEARSNERLRSAFESADMLAMDGMPLVWVAHRRGAATAERVCGPDVLLSLADRGREAGLRHYFLGGAPGVPERLARRLEARFPGLQVVGASSPPFGELSDDQEAQIVMAIQAAKPDVLWVGLGSPRQEIWAAGNHDRLGVAVVLPIGAAFDFHSGRVRRAPRWMQRVGLEWLFRFAIDPRRLGPRYLRTNALFLILLAREWLGPPKVRGR